ncbi:MAG: segregation/condensation protein A [Planctomycetota bacterium]
MTTKESAPAESAATRDERGQQSDEFTVRLEEVFQGPLDLLLHLVKEQELAIQDVRLANVAQAYMEHVRALRDLDIELAGEYLVIAATLMAIKSRSLLPREEVELEDDLDPQDELIQRLIEYRRFKGAADDLEDRFHRRTLEYARGYRGEVRDNEPERTFDLGEVTAWDLLATFSRLMRETAAGRPHTVRADPRPLRWYVREIGTAVRRDPSGTTLRGLVESLGGVPTREGIVGAFCALLELMKIGLISAEQTRQEDEILLKWAATDENDEDIEDLIKASRFMDEDSEDLDEALGGGRGPSPEAEAPQGDEADVASPAD